MIHEVSQSGLAELNRTHDGSMMNYSASTSPMRRNGREGGTPGSLRPSLKNIDPEFAKLIEGKDFSKFTFKSKKILFQDN